jgi:hypothetical protein
MNSNNYHTFSAERRFNKWLSVKSLDPIGNIKTTDYPALESQLSPNSADLDNFIRSSVKHMSQYLCIDEEEAVHALWNAYQDLAQNRFVLGCRNLMNLRELPGSPWFVFNGFDNYLHFCNDFVTRQKSAIERGIPSLHIISFRKSASSFIASVLAQGLDIPACTTSLLHTMIVPSWLRCFLRGGAVTHEHTFPFRANIALLRSHSVPTIIHVRNPKQIIVSHAHFYKKYLEETVKENFTPSQKWFIDASLKERIDFLIDDLIPYYCRWIIGWYKTWEQKALDIKFTSYEEFVRNEDLFFEKIADMFSLSAEARIRIKETRQKLDGQKRMYNIRNMKADEWREVLTSKQQQRVDEFIPHEFDELYRQSLS